MKKLPTITAVDLIEFHPCYHGSKRDALYDFANSRPCWNALEILEQCQYPLTDRFWLVLRPELIPRKLLQCIALMFAEYELDAYCRRKLATREEDFVKAIEVKQQHIAGEVTDAKVSALALHFYRRMDSVTDRNLYHLCNVFALMLSQKSRTAAYALHCKTQTREFAAAASRVQLRIVGEFLQKYVSQES